MCGDYCESAKLCEHYGLFPSIANYYNVIEVINNIFLADYNIIVRDVRPEVVRGRIFVQ